MDHLLEAPCGLHCGVCFLYRAGSDAAIRSLVAEKFGIPLEKEPPVPAAGPSVGSARSSANSARRLHVRKRKGSRSALSARSFPAKN